MPPFSPARHQPVSPRQAELLGSTLFLLRNALSDAIEQELARGQSGLRMSQVQVLLRLGHQDSLTAGELARAIGHDPGALTRLVDQLVKRQLVERHPHETDRRVLRITLTAQGRGTYRMLHGLRLQVMERMLHDFEEDERSLVMDFLQRMLRGLQAHPPSSG